MCVCVCVCVCLCTYSYRAIRFASCVVVEGEEEEEEEGEEGAGRLSAGLAEEEGVVPSLSIVASVSVPPLSPPPPDICVNDTLFFSPFSPFMDVCVCVCVSICACEAPPPKKEEAAADVDAGALRPKAHSWFA